MATEYDYDISPALGAVPPFTGNAPDDAAGLKHAELMVRKYRQLLLKGAGLASMNVDGQTVSLTDMEKKLEYWEERYSRLKQIPAGGMTRKPRISHFKMGGV